MSVSDFRHHEVIISFVCGADTFIVVVVIMGIQIVRWMAIGLWSLVI